MGYTTDFVGSFTLDKPLTAAQIAYLTQFSETRRMQRNASLTMLREDPIRIAVGLPVGEEGEYFVGEDGFSGQKDSPDVVNYNSSACTQPGLWCKWVPTEDGTGIIWSGAEKFYDYIQWLQYIIGHFLEIWGIKLSGEVTWSGEEHGDFGKIVVKDNVMEIKKGHIVYDC